jgi:hypothetical protein
VTKSQRNLALQGGGRITRRFRPWLDVADARMLEALPPAARRSMEALLHAQARTDQEARVHYGGSSSLALNASSVTAARFEFGAGGGRHVPKLPGAA